MVAMRLSQVKARNRNGRKPKRPRSSLQWKLRRLGGSSSELAEFLGLSRQAISAWGDIPAHHVEKVNQYMDRLRATKEEL